MSLRVSPDMVSLALILFTSILISTSTGSPRTNPDISPWATTPECDSTDIRVNQMAARYKALDLDRSQNFLSFVGTALWTATLHIEVYEHYALALNMNGLQVFDIADPENPAVVVQYPMGYCSPYNQMALDGHYLYIPRYDHVHILDISDPLSPQEVSDFVLSGIVWEVQVSDGRAYFGIARAHYDYEDTPAFYIYDVSNPADPKTVGKYEPPFDHRDCRKFEVAGNHVYAVNTWEGKLDIIDISDESRPVQVNYLEIIEPMAVAVHEEYLFVHQWEENTYIFDMSIPDAPPLLDSFSVSPSGSCRSMEVEANRLYSLVRCLDAETLTEWNGVSVHNILGRGHVDSIGFFETRTRWNSITLRDTLLFVPEATHGFTIGNVADPGNASTLAVFSHDVFELGDVVVSGDYAYVTNWISMSDAPSRNGFYVVDISNLEQPELVHWQPISGNTTELIVHDTLLIVSQCPRTEIYLLTTPQMPEFLSRYPRWDPRFTCGVAARDKLLSVCCSGNGVDFVSIFDPHWPGPLSNVNVEDLVCARSRFFGDIVYVSTHDAIQMPMVSRLLTIDITNPSQSVLLDNLFVGQSYSATEWVGYEMTIRNDYLYLAAGAVGLCTIDISNPYLPDLVNRYVVEAENFMDVTWKRNFLFATSRHSLQIFDATDPINPQLVQYFPLTSEPQRLLVDGDYLYVVCAWGFYIFELNLPPAECGDVDASHGVDIDDVVWVIAYVFSEGPAPDPIESGDVDCSGGIDIDDVVYLVMYVFAGSPPPCDTNSDGVPDC